MPLEKSAGAVIFRSEDNTKYYLLLHYKSQHWDFPKGNIEKGEREAETVRREVREETGIGDIEFVSGFRELIKYFYKLTPNQKRFGAGQEGKTVFKTVVFYLAETREKNVKISWEHIGSQWLPYEKALEQLKFKNAKDILAKAHQFLEGKEKDVTAS